MKLKTRLREVTNHKKPPSSTVEGDVYFHMTVPLDSTNWAILYYTGQLPGDGHRVHSIQSTGLVFIPFGQDAEFHLDIIRGVVQVHGEGLVVTVAVTTMDGAVSQLSFLFVYERPNLIKKANLNFKAFIRLRRVLRDLLNTLLRP